MTKFVDAPPQRTVTLPPTDTADVALFDVVWCAAKFRFDVPGHMVPSLNIARKPAALGLLHARFVSTAEMPLGIVTDENVPVICTSRSAFDPSGPPLTAEL